MPDASAPAPAAAPAKSVRARLADELHAIASRIQAAAEAEIPLLASQFTQRAGHIFDRLKADAETAAAKEVLAEVQPAAAEPPATPPAP